MKIGLVGAGKMGEAVVAGVLRQNLAQPADVHVTNRSPARQAYMQQTYGVVASSDNRTAVTGANFVVLGTKPQDFEKAAQDLKGAISAQATVVSLMAGVTLARIGDFLGVSRVVRSMPNTPAQIGEGMTVWTSTPSVDETAREGVAGIFGALGKEAYVPNEKYLDMATGLSGSGPAYVFLFIEALTDAGVHIGLSRDLAATMALQTVLGAARYAEQTGKHPAELRNQVTSPGGTTAEALRAFEAGAFRANVLEAVMAAFNKSKALGEESKN
jgi:pyrroline-5-carboxylate reductase